MRYHRVDVEHHYVYDETDDVSVSTSGRYDYDYKHYASFRLWWATEYYHLLIHLERTVTLIKTITQWFVFHLRWKLEKN